MRLIATDDRIAIAPGEPTAVVIEVFNEGAIIDGFQLEAVGLDHTLPNGEALVATVDVSPPTLRIFPETSGVITAIITLPTGYPSGFRAAELRVRSVSDHDEVGIERIEFDVAKVPAASVTAVPQAVTGGRRAIFGLVLDNTGNVPLALAITVSDAENVLTGPAGTELRSETAPIPGADGTDAQPPPKPPNPPFIVSLAPRERADVRLPVSAPRPVLGTPVTRIVTFAADPGPDSRLEELTAVGTFTQKPLVPRGVLTVVSMLLALLLWAFVLLAAADYATEQVAADNASLAEQQDTTALDAQKTAGTITGSVTDASGTPVGDAAVTAAGDGAAAATTLTDGAVGSFTLAGLPVPGTFTLTVVKDGFEPRTVPFELTEDEPTVSGLTLVVARAGGTVSGTVTDASGQPIPGVVVSAVGEPGTNGASTVTASDGSVGFYALTGLTVPGTYTVTFAKPGFTDATDTATVAPGAPVSLDVTLLAAPSAAITGTVSEARLMRPACTPDTCRLEAATVSVTGADGTAVAATMSAGAGASPGSFTVGGLLPGDYTVTVAKDGYASQVVQVTVASASIAQVDVVLAGLPGSISGVAPGCVRVEVRLRNLEQLNPPRAAQPAGSDGIYGLAELPTPGEYRILFFGPESNGFRDLQLVDITLGPGEARQAVTATCASQPPPG